MSNKPQTAYDYRHYITLVQVLALHGSDERIRDLCAAWGVEVVEDRSHPPYMGRYYLNQWATIAELARYAVAKQREGDHVTGAGEMVGEAGQS